MSKARCLLSVIVALVGLGALTGSVAAQPYRGGGYGHGPHHPHRGYYGGYGPGCGRPVYVAPPPPCYRPVRPVPVVYPAPVIAPAPYVQPGFSLSLFFGR